MMAVRRSELAHRLVVHKFEAGHKLAAHKVGADCKLEAHMELVRRTAGRLRIVLGGRLSVGRRGWLSVSLWSRSRISGRKQQI